MDINKYNENILDLFQKQRSYLQLSDPKVFDVLNQLKKKAHSLHDNELIGYVYHSLAFAHYFIGGNYDAFLQNLRLAANYLFLCDETSELMHVYYLVAIDALNKGLYDLSYHYFLKARNIAKDSKQETSAAILDENIGHILNVLGRYKEARKFFKRSLKGVRKDPKHPHYYNNMASNYMNDGNACLAMGLIDEAEIAYEKTRDFIHANPDAFQIDAKINFAFLNTQIAIKKADYQRMKKGFNEIIELFEQITQLVIYIDVMDELVKSLIEIKEYDLVSKLIDLISKKNLAKDATSAAKKVNEMKIAYYQAINNKDQLVYCFLQQDKINDQIMKEHVESNQYAQDLIILTNDLHQQQESVMKKREELVRNAETDALTGLANRYVCDLHMNQVFEKAFNNKLLFGVCILDIDDLKKYNDTYGHKAGDELIKKMANALAELKDEKVYPSRYGGDEFVIVFENMKTSEIKNIFKKLNQINEVGYSAGIYNAIPKEKMRTWDFLKIADDELYQVKNLKKKKLKTNDLSICTTTKAFKNR